MNNLREAARAALDALNDLPNRRWTECWVDACRHLETVLAEPLPEPVAWIYWHESDTVFDGPDTLRKTAVSRFSDDTRAEMQRKGWRFEPLYTIPPIQSQSKSVAAVKDCVAGPTKDGVCTTGLGGFPKIGNKFYIASQVGRPLTEEQVFSSEDFMTANGLYWNLSMTTIMHIVRCTERAHGIGVKL